LWEASLALWNKAKPALTPPSFDKGDAKGFWRWFMTNEAALARAFSGAPQEMAGNATGQALAAALTRYHKGLVFELGIRPEDRMDFVISADGIFDRFPAVIALKKAAPESKLFEVTAFRQAREGLVLEMNGARFSAGVARFAPLGPDNGGQKLDIAVFLDFQGLGEEHATQAAFILLDTTIGEYDMETLIGRVEVYEAAETEEAESMPLNELPKILEARAYAGTRH
jgi:hypothetical protein